MKRDNLYLIRELVYTDFKLKYYGSIFGFFWSLLKPLLMLGTLYLIFAYLLNAKVDNYAIFLLLGILIWNYFNDSTKDGIQSVKYKKGLVTKAHLEPWIIVFSSCIHSTISFILNFIVFSIFLILANIKININFFIFIYLILLLFIINFFTSLILVIFYTKFNDFGHIWDVLTQIGFWISPIIYPLSIIPLHIQRWYMLNPLARIIVDSRNVIMHNSTPELKQLIITSIIVLIIMVSGVYFYKKYEQSMVESL